MHVRRRGLLSRLAPFALLALALLGAVDAGIIHKVARSFAFSKFPEATLLHRAATSNQLTLQHELSSPIQLEMTASVAKAEVAEKLPTDARTPVENDQVTKALDHIPSDSLPSDALPTPQAVTPIVPASSAGSGAENEMRFRAEAETEAEAQVQTKVSAEERLEDRRARSRVGFVQFGGMGKRFQQQKDKMLGKNQPHVAEVLEDCMGCRYIWNQVEMDVANARYVEDVQSSFEHNCLDAQKAPIFYNACEDMYDDMYALTDDYMSQKYTVDDMCIRAKMCDDPSKKKFSLFG